MRRPDPEAVVEALPIRWPKDVARLRREVPALSGLSDAEIDALYSQWSSDVYFAGWMNLDARPGFVQDFAHWLVEEETNVEEKIDGLFQVHMLNADGKAKAQVIAKSFNQLLADLNGVGALEGREGSLVKTKLEEACFFAKKSMATNLMNQEQK